MLRSRAYFTFLFIFSLPNVLFWEEEFHYHTSNINLRSAIFPINVSDLRLPFQVKGGKERREGREGRERREGGEGGKRREEGGVKGII